MSSQYTNHPFIKDKEFSEYDNKFPRQKLKYKEKIKDDNAWGKQCIESSINKIGNQENSRRSSSQKKQRNYNLFNGVFDKADMEYTVQPLSQLGYTFPAELQYRDIVSPIFHLLFGEEAKRGTSFVVRVLNEDAISQKEDKKKKEVLAKLEEYLIEENPGDPEEALKKLEKYYNYEYQDMRERTASHLLNYLRQSLKLDREFSKGFEDALIAGEELYEIDIISGQPIARRTNPKELSFIIADNSTSIDDSEIIIKDTYMPISQVIDEYWEVLEDSEIDELEQSFDNPDTFNFSLFSNVLDLDTAIPDSWNNWSDSKGNIRVAQVRWKSRKLIGERTWFDEFGKQQMEYVDDEYKGKPDKELGESLEWFWINEYWEGTRIKDTIYKNIRPRRIQYRPIDNISICKSGYVGEIYSANNAESVSLMTRLVPFIYSYITVWYRKDLLLAANQGKIALIDLSLIPDGWDVEKWMYYASTLKFAFVDSFNEGKKGQATGKLANTNADRNKTLDMETGAAILGYIQILEYIEKKLQDLAGVTDQRLGAIQASEGVGNVQRSVTQSSLVTEKYYQVHNYTKQRVLDTLIETAKVAYSTSNKKLQYVTDDLATVFFSYDGNEFINDSYGIVVSDSIKDMQALDAIKQLAQTAIQNDKAELSSIFEIMASNSIAEVKAKLKDSEARIAQKQQQQLQSEQGIEQQKIQLEAKKLEDDNYNKQADRETKIQIAELTALGIEKGADEGNQQIMDQAKLAMEQRKADFAERQSNNQDAIDQQNIELKRQEMSDKKELKYKEIQSKEKIANAKKKETKKSKK
mgnify:CR=1 FL=1